MKSTLYRYSILGFFLLAGCGGVEVSSSTPHKGSNANEDSELLGLTQAQCTSDLASKVTVSPRGQLYINAPEVLNDSRAKNIVDNTTGLGGVWSFAFAMREILELPGTPGNDPKNLIAEEQAVDQFISMFSQQKANNMDSRSRAATVSALQKAWDKRQGSDGVARKWLGGAPFKLVAIVNRMDLVKRTSAGDISTTSAGEGRLVFGFNPPPIVPPAQFNVIFEYDLPIGSANPNNRNQAHWTNAWRSLKDFLADSDPNRVGVQPIQDPNLQPKISNVDGYLKALESITNQFVSRGSQVRPASSTSQPPPSPKLSLEITSKESDSTNFITPDAPRPFRRAPGLVGDGVDSVRKDTVELRPAARECMFTTRNGAPITPPGQCVSGTRMFMNSKLIAVESRINPISAPFNSFNYQLFQLSGKPVLWPDGREFCSKISCAANDSLTSYDCVCGGTMGQPTLQMSVKLDATTINQAAIAQIRTNDFNEFPWELREIMRSRDSSGKVQLAITTNKNTISLASGQTRSDADLGEWVDKNVRCSNPSDLASCEFATVNKALPSEISITGRNNAVKIFRQGPSVPVEGRWFAGNMDKIERRFFALQSCDGCHKSEGLAFFVHTNHRTGEPSQFLVANQKIGNFTVEADLARRLRNFRNLVCLAAPLGGDLNLTSDGDVVAPLGRRVGVSESVH